MLHGLLFALHGNTGSIFKEGSNGEVAVVPGLSYLSPSEEASLNRLLKLSTRIIFFTKFSEAHRKISLHSVGEVKHSDGLLHGLYLRAFCEGLDSVLEVYFQRLLDLEKQILADPLVTYLHVIQSLEEYHILFEALYHLILSIKSHKSHGCQILTEAYNASQNGNQFIQKAILKILQRLHVVMYNQIATFVIHGYLIDQNMEFFIAKMQRENIDDSTETDDSFSSQTKYDDGKVEAFYIRAEMLPRYLPSRDADIILFIGSSLHLFEQVTLKQQAWALTGGVSGALEKLSTEEMGGVPQEKEQEFMADFLWLQKQERFSLEDFESRLNEVRLTVAKELWELCIVKAKLVSQLSMLKDFFLLGLGELHLVFIEEVAKVMRKPVTKMTEYDVNQAFRRSALTVLLEEDGPIQNFKLVIEDRSAKGDGAAPHFPYDASSLMDANDTWSLLGMTFKVRWPLHIIFSSTVLSKYNKLYKFLLRVRRTQLALQRLWALQMQTKCSLIHGDDDTDLKRSKSNLTLRMHMSHLVDSLQNYLQADVLESHFSNLLSKIRDPASTDFEQIIMAHDSYLTALLAQCFILSTPVFRSLLGVLEICQQFCEVVTASIQSGTVAAQEVIEERVEKFAKNFERQSSLLFHTLSAVCNQQCNPHLAQFLLLLDYNKYYTQHL